MSTQLNEWKEDANGLQQILSSLVPTDALKIKDDLLKEDNAAHSTSGGHP